MIKTAKTANQCGGLGGLAPTWRGATLLVNNFTSEVDVAHLPCEQFHEKRVDVVRSLSTIRLRIDQRELIPVNGPISTGPPGADPMAADRPPERPRGTPFGLLVIGSEMVSFTLLGL